MKIKRFRFTANEIGNLLIDDIVNQGRLDLQSHEAVGSTIEWRIDTADPSKNTIIVVVELL